MTTTPRRAALYCRASTADRGQTIENQLLPLQEAAARLGWQVVAAHMHQISQHRFGRTDAVVIAGGRVG